MIPKLLEQVTEADLENLITLRTAERKTLDYKRELPGRSPTDRDKFVANVSSFANTLGGDLIFGIDAPSGTGEPESIPGLELVDPEEEKLRLEQYLQSGLRPRLPRHDLRFVQLVTGRYVLVIRVWQSWTGPHRVGDHGPFYARNSSGKYQLDVGELRQAFGLSGSISERITAFRAERITRVYANELPTPIEDGPRLVIHVTPTAAFAPFPEIDVTDALRAAFADSGDNFGLMIFQPFSHTGSWKQFINLEGRVVIPVAFGGRPADRSYVQVYRSGILETVWALPFNTRQDDDQTIPFILCDQWVPDLVKLLPSYLAGLVRLGIMPPFFIFLSLLSIREHYLVAQRHISTPRSFDRDQILLPEIFVESLPADLKPLIKRPLDMLWNAVGAETSPYGQVPSGKG